MDRNEIKEILEGCEFFKGLEEPCIKNIIALCQVQNFEPGEYVFSQGDFGEYLYVIAEGHVSLERSMDLGARKGNAVIGLLGKRPGHGMLVHPVGATPHADEFGRLPEADDGDHFQGNGAERNHVGQP